MEVAVTNYGCAILAIMVPDKDGKYANVVLGHDSIDHVVNSPEPFLSTTIGRYGNRIAKGKFTLYGEEHELTINNGPNSLHGGPTGFHARVWDADQLAENIIQFNYVSADGEEGFPGNLEVEMVYRLEEEENALVIEYRATTDKATVVNLTNHGFFNLAGISNPTPTIENNIVTINANFYTPIDEVSIPTGEVAKVEGTPMDFSTIPIGAARLVTNEIIPKRKIIVIMAMIFPFFFSCVMVLLKMLVYKIRLVIFLSFIFPHRICR